MFVPITLAESSDHTSRDCSNQHFLDNAFILIVFNDLIKVKLSIYRYTATLFIYKLIMDSAMKKLTTKKNLENRKKNKLIAIGFALLLLFIGVFIIIEQNNKPDITPYLYAEHAAEYGNKNAKVTIVEFFDPACESCRAFYPLVKQQIKQYKGKVKLVARPAAFHRNVDQVVAALEASKIQNKFWDALHVVFYYQSSWTLNHTADVNLVYPYLQDIGVDIDKLKIDMKSQSVADIMQKDAQDAKVLRVLKTPTFFVNGQVLDQFGAEPFKTLIAEQVKLAYADD